MQNEQTGFLRLSQIVNTKLKTKDGKAVISNGIIPIGRSAWYKRINEGRAPEPLKLGERAAAWRARDVHALIGYIDVHGEWPESWPLPAGGSE